MAKTKAKKRQSTQKLSFHKQLVLNQFMMQFFHSASLAELKRHLDNARFEGIHDDGQTHFFHCLTQNLLNLDLISEDELRRYDLNIVTYWQEITQHRNRQEDTVLNMKYFQYLSLLFTEIYLDWYFNKKQRLLDGLNQALANYNAMHKEAKNSKYRFQPYKLNELNKVAYWNATGSGKTLLLHINIKQYLHYFQNGNGQCFPDNIILLTPDERLSQQHLKELQLSGFTNAGLFSKNNNRKQGGLFKGAIEIIDINKLADDMGDKTVAVEAFEGDNLILIDEGHKGAASSAGAWMKRRHTLTKHGFAFEYSATFGQAVGDGNSVEASELEIQKHKSKMLFSTADFKKLTDAQKLSLQLDEHEKQVARIQATREVYAKSILFDYSYKFFYDDGYGKESVILNLNADQDNTHRNEYLTACLLSFYQQQYLFSKHAPSIAQFNLEKPLWVFVGSSVAKENSDIQQVLQYIAYFLREEQQVKAWIKDFVANQSRLLDTKERNLFDKRFLPLGDTGRNEHEIYQDILQRLFNTTHSGQRLTVVHLKGSQGEYALRLGTSAPFGVINVGDSSALNKSLAEQETFDFITDDFAKTLFNTINHQDSKIHMLIGSRKFTEGWSSWRVSTMGLLNMGKSEGSQVIQLFGRGVRLKGKNYSLKRSTQLERPKGKHLEKLETLNIFGIKADYMAQFKQYLEMEGVELSSEMLELDFTTGKSLPKTPLKTLKLKDGYKNHQAQGFKRVHFPYLYAIPEEFKDKIKEPHITLDLYPKVAALSTQKNKVHTAAHDKTKVKISTSVISAFNFERIYLKLQAFKLQRGWSNLRLDKGQLKDFCLGNSEAGHHWYTLYLPKQELEVTTYSDIYKQEAIFLRLLEDYTDRFYKALKNAYEGQFFEVSYVQEDDSNILNSYHIEINESDEGYSYATRLETLQELVKKGDLGQAKQWHAPGITAITFDKHLYYPMLSVVKGAHVPLKMRPVAFDSDSEVQFVQDLQQFVDSPKGMALLGTKSVYLLRNADSKAKGLGFALAENFYPDFLFWLVDESSGEQWLSLIDPKGIRLIDINTGKFGLYREIKKYEQNGLKLSSFILSCTQFNDLLNTDKSKEELEQSNIIFMEDGAQTYFEKIIHKMTR